MITVIIPSYNSAHMVSYTLHSVLASTTTDYEIIVVNDGSSDDTTEVITPFLHDKRIRYIEQENKGLSGARNTGITHAKGKYLVFLDSDDIILPKKLQVQSHYLDQHPDIDIVFSDSQWFVEDDFNDTRPVAFPVYTGNVLSQLLFGNFMHVNSVMVRTEKVREIGCFDENFKELEDWDLWLRLSINGSLFGYTQGILSKVRIRKGSMTSNQMKMNKAMVRVLEKNIPLLSQKNHSKQMINKAYHALFIYRLKAKQTKGYLWDLFKIFLQQGMGFLPIALKMKMKYFLSPFLKQNSTTKELEEIWGK